MRIPDGHREILEEYCRVFGTTPSSTICGYIVEDLWQALAARVNYEKLHFSNIYSRASTSVENNLLSLRRKRVRIFPMTLILLEIAQKHGLDHEKAVHSSWIGRRVRDMSKRIGSQLIGMHVASGSRKVFHRRNPDIPSRR